MTSDNTDGAVNSGGGGGGGSYYDYSFRANASGDYGSSGGSGIAIIRWKFQ
jgi:hypothetical protein